MVFISGRVTLNSPSTEAGGDLDRIYNPEEQRTFSASHSVATNFPVYTATAYESADFGAAGTFSANNGQLKTYASAYGGGFAPIVVFTANAFSSVTWQDRLLYYNASNPTLPPLIPPNGLLYFNFRVHGVLDAFNTPGQFPYEDPHFAGAGTRVYFGQENGQFPQRKFFDSDRSLDSSHVLIDEVVSFSLDIAIPGPIGNIVDEGVTWTLESGADVPSGAAYSDFYNTFTLESITYADGTTPESHGYGISFGSGIQSPNITAVPEPSSMVLGAVGMLACLWTRRKKKFK